MDYIGLSNFGFCTYSNSVQSFNFWYYLVIRPRTFMGKNTFFKFYANLPLNLRRDVVLDLGEDGGGPITWEVAYREINNNTEKGEEILRKLIELKFIPSE